MKSNIYYQFEISDEQRSQLADILDSEKSKRIATRDEIKAFVTEQAVVWEKVLADEHEAAFGKSATLAVVPDPEPEAAPAATDLDDLI